MTILWDTDDIGCPPDNYTSLLFLNALHKVRLAVSIPCLANLSAPTFKAIQVLTGVFSNNEAEGAPSCVSLRRHATFEHVSRGGGFAILFADGIGGAPWQSRHNAANS